MISGLCHIKKKKGGIREKKGKHEFDILLIRKWGNFTDIHYAILSFCITKPEGSVLAIHPGVDLLGQGYKKASHP